MAVCHPQWDCFHVFYIHCHYHCRKGPCYELRLLIEKFFTHIDQNPPIFLKQKCLLSPLMTMAFDAELRGELADRQEHKPRQQGRPALGVVGARQDTF